MKPRSHSIAAANQLAAALALISLTLSGCGSDIPQQVPVNMEQAEKIREQITEGTGGAVAAAVQADPTGWATLKGTFKFPPADASKFSTQPSLEISGDDAVFCSAGGPPKSKSLLVNAAGQIENVVIYLSDDLSKMENQDKWVHPSKAPGSVTQEVIFDQKGCVFLNPLTTMQVSQPLKIINSDGVSHNTKLPNDNPMVPVGGTFTYKNRKESRIPFGVSCSIHPWMKAYILVRDNGYFAQTNDKGEFVIENLPAGVDLTMKVWHEKVGFVTDVTVNGEEKKWSKKGFPVKLTADGEMNFDVTVDAAPFSN